MLVTFTVAVSVAVAGVFSSSRPVTVTVLVTEPTFSGVGVVTVKVKLSLGARTTAPLFPWLIQAARAAVVKFPSTLSMTLVIVTGSVAAGLVLVIVKL